MQNTDTDSIPMETLKLAADVLARPETPETKEIRTLAQALVDANSSITVLHSQNTMAQKT